MTLFPQHSKLKKTSTWIVPMRYVKALVERFYYCFILVVSFCTFSWFEIVLCSEIISRHCLAFHSWHLHVYFNISILDCYIHVDERITAPRSCRTWRYGLLIHSCTVTICKSQKLRLRTLQCLMNLFCWNVIIKFHKWCWIRCDHANYVYCEN